MDIHTTTLPRTTTQPAVRLVDVHKTYAGATPVAALRGVTLDLGRGTVTAIMGQSGSGKSTLLNVAAGLDQPTRGRVVIGDQDTAGLSPDRLTRLRREQVGFVFQSYNLIGHLDVRANIELPLVLGGRSTDEAWLAELVGSLGLTGLTGRLPGELSGGQAQRVAIARALVTRPTVVFADEPTGALDSRTGAQVLELLRDTARRLDQTVVLVTHDSVVAAAAERVVLLADGLVVDELLAPTVEQVTARMLGLGR
ncbi:ABC transporter ATP-binding protein [Nocardioides sp. SYSU D00038]|uniref:ABC transporter ATP-binding protein n=1 Tax=Nocardioides sp. SYSU D00038 TaxID=2812554 RepID=UPI0019674DCF|nr:ABC transporter ATP-binding protein [Nocardioides sp. SYSU D00038]